MSVKLIASVHEEIPDDATSREEILAMYSVGPDKAEIPQNQKAMDFEEISDTENESAFEGKGKDTAQTSAADTKGYVESMNPCSRKLERRMADGSLIQAEMKQGPAGFALARFPNEDTGIPTNMPNLMLALPRNPPKEGTGRKRKPAIKRPVANMAKMV